MISASSWTVTIRISQPGAASLSRGRQSMPDMPPSLMSRSTTSGGRAGIFFSASSAEVAA